MIPLGTSTAVAAATASPFHALSVGHEVLQLFTFTGGPLLVLSNEAQRPKPHRVKTLGRVTVSGAPSTTFRRITGTGLPTSARGERTERTGTSLSTSDTQVPWIAVAQSMAVAAHMNRN